jgi:hypothetical protein
MAATRGAENVSGRKVAGMQLLMQQLRLGALAYPRGTQQD